jgi:hypothetical protein
LLPGKLQEDDVLHKINDDLENNWRQMTLQGASPGLTPVLQEFDAVFSHKRSGMLLEFIEVLSECGELLNFLRVRHQHHGTVTY